MLQNVLVAVANSVMLMATLQDLVRHLTRRKRARNIDANFATETC